MTHVTDALCSFALNTNFGDIPEDVIHEMKRILIDGLGNAVGGIASDKGKIGLSFAGKVGGTPEATVLGVGGKISAPMAAFVNSELLNGLDYDPIPHIPPILIPSVLAVAEAERADGKSFLTALTIGHDVAARLNGVLGSVMMSSIAKYGKTPDVFGNSNENMLGAAIGNALLMKLDHARMAQALGISAYFCPLPVCRDWESTLPKTMIKYAPVSWCAQGAVQAAMIAREGYTGNAYTLDSEYGFPVIYCRENVWDPDKVIEGLGEKWAVRNTMFKPYPCCRFLHASLDVFYRLKAAHGFSPESITAVRCHTGAFVAHPDQYAVSNQIDAQFSGPYNIALAAFGYTPGPQWQDKRCLTDPTVHDFMQKVTMHVAPEYSELKKTEPGSFYARVEIDLKDGTTLVDSTDYPRGSNTGATRISTQELTDRFRICAGVILPDHKIEKALDIIQHLEDYDSLDPLMEALTL